MIYVRRKKNNHKNHIAPDVNSPALCGEIRDWEKIYYQVKWLSVNGYCKRCRNEYKNNFKMWEFIEAL